MECVEGITVAHLGHEEKKKTQQTVLQGQVAASQPETSLKYKASV